jgi:hypothetical protein
MVYKALTNRYLHMEVNADPIKEGWKYAPNIWKMNIKNGVGPVNDNVVWRTR